MQSIKTYTRYIYPAIASTTLLAAPLLSANPGEVVYKQFCAACHGVDGKGMAGGAFPPLAGSDWVKGDINRVSQILLHGITGPIEVSGKSYNLMMPPQGALSDAQKVDVINYIRTKWGNDPKPFTLDALTKAKEKSKAQTGPWKAEELLKHYPLPITKGVLHNLIMTTYDGAWNLMPDFSQLKPLATEEEHSGFLTLKRINKPLNFGVVWEGEIEITKEGEYEFEIESDDGSKMFINNVQIAAVKGTGAMGRIGKGSAKLTAGRHPFKFEYFQRAGGVGIAGRMKIKGTKEWTYLSEKPKPGANKPKLPVIDLTPAAGENARVFNNYIVNTGHRAIAVGFAEKTHYFFNTELCTLGALWKGQFISGGLRWTNRGIGATPVMEKATEYITNTTAAWYVNGQAVDTQFKGYKLDIKGNPTLKYTVNGTLIEDTFTPSATGMKRVIKLTSNAEQSLSFLANKPFNNVSVQLTSASSKEAKLETIDNKQWVNNLTNETLTLDYQW